MTGQNNNFANSSKPPLMDRLARTRISHGSVSLPAFQFCGYTGLVFAISLGALLAVRSGLSLWVISVITIAAMATFLVLAFATKIITGQEQLIYYHQEIAIVLVSAVVAKLLHRPALPYMDITILGVGTFLAFGRIGCLMVGCCHGRPCHWGIRYRREHAEEGFAPYLVGVRLFPIQALESLFVFAVVIVGTTAVLQRHPAGTAFALYTVGYGFTRFCLEFFRGDSDRPYTFGFSQGQWLSLWLMCGVAWVELAGRMTFHAWHLAVSTAVPLIMLVVTLWRRLDHSQRFQIQHPHHVSEIAGALKDLQTIGRYPEWNADVSLSPLQLVPVASTSLGLQISTGCFHRGSVSPAHYTISFADSRIGSKGTAKAAGLIRALKPDSPYLELIGGTQDGVVHLVPRIES